MRHLLIRFLFVCCVMALSVGLTLFLAWSSESTLPTVVSESDWPQLGRDPQRTNASPLTVEGPYRFYWRWVEVPLASRIQPVVGDGRLFVGSLNGVMYALEAAYDAQGGNPRIIWQRDLESPIRSSAGVDGDVVVVGTHHGTIYGLDASNGKIRWTVSTGGAILAAPLIYDGMAYLGSADGFFYAIRTSNGTVTWKQSIGVPILGSAALSSNGRSLFFVAENVVAYALAVDTGAILWQSQLQGQSGSDRWPVVTGDLVVFRTMPIDYFHRLLHTGDDVMDGAGTRLQDWTADWSVVRPKITQHLADNPADQTFFALDAVSGESRGIAPVLYTFGSNDAPSPPVVSNNTLYLPYRARHGIQTDSDAGVHVTTLYDAELGLMDPASLDITGLTTSDTFVYQFRLTSDEAAVLSSAGDLLLIDNWDRLGGIRLTDGALVGVAQAALDSPCYAGLTPNDDLMPFFEDCPWPGPSVGEGHARTGAIAASGRIFWRVGASGLAAIGTRNGVDTPPVAVLAARQPNRGRTPEPIVVSRQPLIDYVWTEPRRPVDVPADLRRRLEQEIEHVVDSNEHLMPFYLERGFHGGGSWPPDVASEVEPASVAGSNAFWYDPGELILSLSIAYPYLDSSLQVRLRDYLEAEIERFSALEPLPWPTDSWLKQGRAREPYAVPIRGSLNTWPPPSVPIQTLYALWSYARYTGDWDYLSAQWDRIQALFYAKKDAIDSYAEIAGAIGYARISEKLGYLDEASAGEAVAVQAMEVGLDFAKWLDQANKLYPSDPNRPGEKPGRRAPVFFGLTPEVGRYLRDTNLAAVESVLDDVAGYPDGSYLWYATRLGLQAETGESSYHSPELGWSVFLAHAYVRQESQAKLRYWLDRPWGTGDLWYVQKLVATIETPVESTHRPFAPEVFRLAGKTMASSLIKLY